MQNLIARYPSKITRFFEMILRTMSWLLVTMPVWLSFWHPALVAYLVITFDIYWFYKSITLAYHGTKAFVTMTAHAKIDWLAKAKELPDFDHLYHVIIIPEYKEPIHILRRTLTNLANQDYSTKRIIVVLATEGKDPEATET